MARSIAEEGSRTPGLFDHVKARISEALSDRPLERVETLEDFLEATRRKRARNMSALISVMKDEKGVHAGAILRSQSGDQADVTVLNESFPEPVEGEAEDVWRLRVAYAVDEQF